VIKNWWALFEEHEDEPDWMMKLMDCLSEHMKEEVWEVGKRKRKEVEGEREEEVGVEWERNVRGMP